LLYFQFFFLLKFCFILNMISLRTVRSDPCHNLLLNRFCRRIFYSWSPLYINMIIRGPLSYHLVISMLTIEYPCGGRMECRALLTTMTLEVTKDIIHFLIYCYKFLSVLRTTYYIFHMRIALFLTSVGACTITNH